MELRFCLYNRQQLVITLRCMGGLLSTCRNDVALLVHIVTTMMVQIAASEHSKSQASMTLKRPHAGQNSSSLCKVMKLFFCCLYDALTTWLSLSTVRYRSFLVSVFH